MIADFFLDFVKTGLVWLQGLLPDWIMPTPAEYWVDWGRPLAVLNWLTGMGSVLGAAVTIMGLTLTIAIMWGVLKLLDWVMDVIP